MITELNGLLELVRVIVNILNSELLWLYIVVVVLVFYGVIALLTWSFKKPLMFLGIPSIIVGIILVILRFTADILFTDEMFLTLLSSAIEPLLTIGISCTVAGILMIVLYMVLKKLKKKDNEEGKPIETKKDSNDNKEDEK